MRIARFSAAGEVSFGVVEPAAAAAEAGDSAGDPTVASALTITPIDGHPFAAFRPAGPPQPLSSVRLLAPVLPSKVVAIGRNYAEHAAELGNALSGDPGEPPVVFLKPSTAVVGPGDAIAYPRQSSEVHHEAELAVVIGRLCRDVPRERAAEVILGYTCANDVTARDLQKTDKQWGRAKGFDTFCPLGPWVETDLDPSDVRVSCAVNGQVRQDGRTSQMTRGVPELVAHVSAAMTLLPGDVLLTGTPAGVGPLAVGDEVTVSVEGIGALRNPVVARD